MNATEPHSPEFMLGYCAYKPGDTLMHCPFWVVDSPAQCEKYTGWYAAWEDYQDRLAQFGE